MVAISLKGNLHKAAEVPQRWPRPIPKISLEDFKILRRRRTRALSRLSSDVATTSNGNPASDPNSNPNCGGVNPRPASNGEIGAGGGNNGDYRRLDPGLTVKVDLEGEGEKDGEREEGKVADEVSAEGEGCFRKLVERSDALVAMAEKDVENVNNDGVAEAPADKKVKTENGTADDGKTREVKQKLEILNEKKHSLVQVLKQILNAEEHLKRQSSTQGMSSRPPVALQVDNTTDSGSMTKVNTPLEQEKMEILVVIRREEKPMMVQIIIHFLAIYPVQAVPHHLLILNSGSQYQTRYTTLIGPHQ